MVHTTGIGRVRYAAVFGPASCDTGRCDITAQFVSDQFFAERPFRPFGNAKVVRCHCQHHRSPFLTFVFISRKTGGKLTSHLLSAHGGEIFIHTLHISRNCLEDLPSILEGGGGKVTDYRINDFAAFIQNHKLVPLKVTPDRHADRNLTRLRANSAKRSSYWPLTVSSTIIYNIRQFLEPMLSIIAKDDVADEDVLKCQQIIYNLMSLESRQEPLTLPVGAHRLKGSKKEEQYRLLWAELELLLELGPQSVGHKKILKLIKNDQSNDKNDSDVSMRDVDSATKRLNNMSKIANSPMSPPGSSEQIVLGKNKSINLSSNMNGNRWVTAFFITSQHWSAIHSNFHCIPISGHCLT